MNCTQCGKELTGKIVYCPHCGYRIRSTPGFDDHLQEILKDRYKILRRIGKGGMAVVYAAKDLALDRQVAMKVLFPEFSGREELVIRFLQEARLAARLDNHPHIVRIYDIRQVGDVNFFTMSLLGGGTLTQRIAQHGRLSIEESVSIALQVASALDHAHQTGIIHRDIKPENILFDTSGNVVVTDFGIAKVSLAPGITRPGMVLGTPLYMSPEQIRDDELGPASDLYSLGIVFYEMLTGAPPFLGHDGMAVMQRHIDEAPRAPHDVRPEIPIDLSEIVTRLLIKVPFRRISSGKELQAALQRAQISTPSNTFPTVISSQGAMLDMPPASPVAVPESSKFMANQTSEEAVPQVLPAALPKRRSRKLRFLWAAAGIVLLGLIGWLVIGQYWKPEPAEPPPRYSLYQQVLPQLAGKSRDERIAFLETIRLSHPDDTSVDTALANMYYESSQFNKAGQCYSRVIAREPGNFEAGSDLASVLYRLRRVDEAVRQWQSVLQLNPDHAKSLLNLGLIQWAEKGDSATAIQCWERLIKTNPNSPYAQQAQRQLQALLKTSK